MYISVRTCYTKYRTYTKQYIMHRIDDAGTNYIKVTKPCEFRVSDPVDLEVGFTLLYILPNVLKGEAAMLVSITVFINYMLNACINPRANKMRVNTTYYPVGSRPSGVLICSLETSHFGQGALE